MLEDQPWNTWYRPVGKRLENGRKLFAPGKEGLLAMKEGPGLGPEASARAGVGRERIDWI